MRLTEFNSKIVSLSYLSITLLFLSICANAQQLITKIPSGEFSPEPEEIEDYNVGIILYDQYAINEADPLIRKDQSGISVNGKLEDSYANGFILHKGSYDNGVLKSYTNYYINGSKERVFKGKKAGEGKLTTYFINGYIRYAAVYSNHNLVEMETYYNNGVLKRKEVLDEETLETKLVVTKNNENTLMTKLEVIDEDSLIYEKEINRVGGGRIAYGRMILEKNSGEIINDGPYYTYDRDGNLTSEVVYEGGNVKEVKLDERPEDEREYFSFEAPTDEPAVTSTEKETEKTLSERIIPSTYGRFDLNADDFISNKEVDNAVSEFFEDDSITLDQINGLVNYFFEQD